MDELKRVEVQKCIFEKYGFSDEVWVTNNIQDGKQVAEPIKLSDLKEYVDRNVQKSIGHLTAKQRNDREYIEAVREYNLKQKAMKEAKIAEVRKFNLMVKGLRAINPMVEIKVM